MDKTWPRKRRKNKNNKEVKKWKIKPAIAHTVIGICSLACNCHEVIMVLLHCCKVVGSVELKLFLLCCTEVAAWTKKPLASPVMSLLPLRET